MALTKVTGQVIKNTTDVTVGVLTVTNTLAVGGTVSIGGTLTYEDVTNIDAVGLITARNGIVVGSGITLSKDGDVFFTGIATGNGSGLTALNASNIASGTVPTARLGSGTASSSTFLRGDSSFQTVNTDLVLDTSPQLGGNLDSNGANILFSDSSSAGTNLNRLKFGTGTDLHIWHNGSTGNSNISAYSGDLYIQGNDGSGTGVNQIAVKSNAAVELNYQGTKKFETSSTGASVSGNLDLSADNYKLRLGGGNDIELYTDGSNSYLNNENGNWYIHGSTGSNSQEILIRPKQGEQSIRAISDGAVELYYDNSKKIETAADGVNLAGTNLIFQGSSNRLIKYRSGDNDMIYEFDSGDFMRQDIGNSRHEFFVGNTKRVSVTSDGLTFGSDTAADNALDDYEEGTYTPVVYYDSVNNHTYSEQVGTYTKIGNFCHGYIVITWDENASSGQVGFSLPFTSSNISGTRTSGYFIYQDGLNIPSGQGSTHLILYGGQNSSSIYAYFTGSTNNSELGTSPTQLTNSHTSVHNTARMVFHYRTA
jgi:hypothetical protein